MSSSDPPPDMDWTQLSESMVNRKRAALNDERANIQLSHDSLNNKDSAFAKVHQRLLRMYDAMIEAIKDI